MLREPASPEANLSDRVLVKGRSGDSTICHGSLRARTELSDGLKERCPALRSEARRRRFVTLLGRVRRQTVGTPRGLFGASQADLPQPNEL
jgi:hypothetical protein